MKTPLPPHIPLILLIMRRRNDILWKGGIEDFFADMLRFYFKDANKIFDFSKGFVFFDKELNELFPGKEVKFPKHVDKLVKVYLKKGGTRWFLIHIEVQGYSQKTFAKRMYNYYVRLTQKYNVPVTCLAIFLGKRGKNNQSYYENTFLGSKVRFDFNAYYIQEQDEQELMKSKNPFAVIVLTALTALKKYQTEHDLLNWKISLVRNLLSAGFSKIKTKKLLDFIYRYIQFGDKQISANFEKRVRYLTRKNDKSMGITEQILDIAKKEGEEIGEKRGERRGERRGQTGAKMSIAKQLKSLGVAIDIIAKSTGLSLRRIKAL